jgi:hypothetical protein
MVTLPVLPHGAATTPCGARQGSCARHKIAVDIDAAVKQKSHPASEITSGLAHATDGARRSSAGFEALTWPAGDTGVCATDVLALTTRFVAGSEMLRQRLEEFGTSMRAA